MDDNDDEGDNINEEYDKFDTPVNIKYKYEIYSKSILNEQKERGKIIEKLTHHSFIIIYLNFKIIFLNIVMSYYKNG